MWSAHLPEGFGCCLDRVGSCNCTCVSELATVDINSLLCVAAAFMIAVGIIKEMGSQHLKYSQQLESLVNTLGHGVHTFMKGESEHASFFYS